MKRQGENVKKQKGGRGLQQTGRRADDREADEEDVSLGVRERAETVVIFLTGSIPETQVDGLAIDHHVRAVVVKHSRDVLAVLGEETHNSTGETKKKKKSPPKYQHQKVQVTNPGKALVVKEMRRQVLPTAPSPTTTHLMVCMVVTHYTHSKEKTTTKNGQSVNKRTPKVKQKPPMPAPPQAHNQINTFCSLPISPNKTGKNAIAAIHNLSFCFFDPAQFHRCKQLSFLA